MSSAFGRDVSRIRGRTSTGNREADGFHHGGGDDDEGVDRVVLACFAKKKSAEVQRESPGVTGG